MNYSNEDISFSEKKHNRRYNRTYEFELYPVRKAAVANGGNVYYLPVTQFPIPTSEKRVIKPFLERLMALHEDLEEKKLHHYLGVVDSALEFEVLEKVGEKILDWKPEMALALLPDLPSPHLPSREEVMALQDPSKVREMMPMIACINDMPAVADAYESLFGCGGLALFVSAHEKKQFYDKNRQVFGHKIKIPCFQSLNCLPFFRVDPLLKATEKQYLALYSVLSLYIGESVLDEGLVIISNRCLDKIISDLAHLLRANAPR